MPNKKYNCIALPMTRGEHLSHAPVDATLWSMCYLQQQGVQNKSWYRHLDFVKMDVNEIKAIFWTNFVEKKYDEYVPPPMALRRDPQNSIALDRRYRWGERLRRARRLPPLKEEGSIS